MPIRANTEAEEANIDVWAGTAVGSLRYPLGAAALVRKDLADQVAGPFHTINVNVLGDLTARQKGEGADVVSDAPTTGNVPVTLTYHTTVSWEVEGSAQAQANPGGIDYRQKAIDTLAEAIETHVLSVYADAGDQLGVAGTPMTEASLLAAKKALSALRCPRLGRVAFISEDDEIALLSIDKLSRADARGDGGETLREGYIGRLHGFDLFSSQLVVETAGPPVTKHNLFFHPDGILLAMRPLPMADSGTGAMSVVIVDNEGDSPTMLSFRYEVAYNSKAQKVLHTIDALYGVEIIDPRLVIEYLT